MEEYNLTLTKDEFDSVKYALSIAQLKLEYSSVNSAMWGNTEASETYKEQSQKMEKLLEDLKKYAKIYHRKLVY